MDRLYSATPDGYCGDEDNGQTSAWYVFSALGFYSVCPGTNEFALGSPLFKKVTLHHANGATTTISAPANSRENRYVGTMSVNGATWTKNYLTTAQLTGNTTIAFDMQAKPNYNRGTADSDFPYSFSTSNKLTINN